MCVIVYKPFNKQCPTEEQLKLCWERNPHGAGFAILMQDDQEQYYWKVHKGLMEWEDFLSAWQAEDITDENCAVLHFRIKSKGEVNKKQTHPFVISDKFKDMTKLKFDTDTIVFHNGTCGKGAGKAGNDTMVFIQDIIHPLDKYRDDTKLKAILNKLLDDTHDRWFIAHRTVVEKYGVWTEVDGCWYSNTLWKPYKPAQSSYKPQLEVVMKAVMQLVNGVWQKFNIDSTTLDEAEAEAPDEYQVDTIVICPECYEDKYLKDSDYSVGDTICERCGAVFDEGDDVVYFHDEDIRETYDSRGAMAG